MEKINRSETEEIVQESVELQDLAVCQVQEEDLDVLQSNQQLQKSEDRVQKEAFQLSVTHKLMQQEKEVPSQEVKSQYSLQKSEENESSRQECSELAEDEELEQKTEGNIVVQQKDESSFAPEHDSSQTNRPEVDTTHKNGDAFSNDNLLESDVSTTVQHAAETPERILLLPDRNPIQITQHKDKNATYRDCVKCVENESLKPKLETNWTDRLKVKTLEESSTASMEDPTLTTAQETNDGVQQECDRTAENGRHFQESEYDPESEESHHACLRTQQVEEETSLPLPSRICYHRTHRQRQRLPPIPEVPDEPLEPFQVEITVRRNRMLGTRLPTVPTGFREYMQRVRDRHITPERRARYEEIQKRVLKLLLSLLIGGILYGTMFLVLDFLESKFRGNDDSNATSPADFNATSSADFNATSPADFNATSSADFNATLNISATHFKPISRLK